jgi:hypothetical protein
MMRLGIRNQKPKISILGVESLSSRSCGNVPAGEISLSFRGLGWRREEALQPLPFHNPIALRQRMA